MSLRAVDLTAVVELLDRQQAVNEFSGVVVITQGEEELLAGTYGYASRTWRVPMDRTTRFDTASITKLFTAVATLQLIDDGHFDLETPVVEYLQLSGTTFSRDINPYHLLTHTSGIADDADEEADERYEDLFVDLPNYSVRDFPAALSLFSSKPPNFAPGEGCRYCNAGYQLLGMMIERASGQPYRSYVADRVFAAAGMDRSGFFAMDVVEPDVAEAVEPIRDEAGAIIGWRRNVYSYPPVGDPAGGAHVTADDLVQFHRALCSGRLLSPEMTAAMLSPKVRHGARGEGDYLIGFGLEFATDAAGEVRCSWKEGTNVGTSGILLYYPSVDVRVALLAVGEDAAWDAVKLMDGAVLGTAATTPSPPA